MRYYYDCQFKAAYMCRHFGVKLDFTLENSNKPFNKEEIKSNEDPWSVFSDGMFIKDKIYVAPESEEIMKPKEGDIGITEKYPTYFTGGKWSFDDYQIVNISKIIMRDNKHFFQAEVESE